MRIMFMANAPWCTTGYGVQGKHLVWRWKALGHDVAYFAFYGLQNGMLHIDGVPIYPMGHRPWGEDVLEAHMEHFGADVLITLMDVWVTDWFGRRAQRGGWVWCPWTPIDQEPVPDLVLQRLQGAHTVLPYSRWGEAQLRMAGVENVRYIPHAVDTRTFRPFDDERRAAIRRKIGIPNDAFVIGMVAANKGYPPRKAFPEQLLAFRKMKEHVPNAVMYLHTLRTSAHGGIDFDPLLRRLGLEEGRDVFFTDQYRYTVGLAENVMVELYNAFDVLSLTSMGEGFGIPIIEAQACGIPVVVAENTAMPELCFGGYVVPKGRLHPFWTPLGAWAYLPDPDAVLEGYMILYEMWASRPDEWSAMRQRARAEVVKRFDWNIVVADHWHPFLTELERDLGLEPG